MKTGIGSITGLLATALLLAGCAGEAGGVPDVAEETGEAASAASYDDNTVVSRLGNGLFLSSTGVEVTITQSGPSRRYYVDYGYWIDLSVKDLAYDKSVGIIWTDDGWQHAHVSYAGFEAGLGNGYERWGLDLTGRSYSGSPPVIEYAAFATMNGNTYYGKEDNWKNYQVTPY